MPRDGSGNYTLPAGNPVVDDTIIETSWANPTMSDIAAELNNVITQDGLRQPLLPLKFVDGTSALPGATFAAQLGTGLWNAAASSGYSFRGAPHWTSSSSKLTFNVNVEGGNATFTGDLSVVGNTIYGDSKRQLVTGALLAAGVWTNIVDLGSSLYRQSAIIRGMGSENGAANLYVAKWVAARSSSTGWGISSAMDDLVVGNNSNGSFTLQFSGTMLQGKPVSAVTNCLAQIVIDTIWSPA